VRAWPGRDREPVLLAEREGRLAGGARVMLARRCGFEDASVHRRHARLAGQWRDVLIVERLLGDAA
jgi:L-amino acid N-acyltransferase YncA